MIFKIFAVFSIAVAAGGQRRYYSLEQMPETNFDCRDKILGGYYADPEANCQMFHVCVKIPGQGVQDFRFLCPNETVFDQENQICADSGDIDCEASGLYLENFDLYRIGSAPAKKPFFGSSKGTGIPLGPSTKSPILTNNINEDDEFYLQRSETGDRRLHSKDLLRGSSSSNFFNNRNKGKDLEDDDDEEPLMKNNGNGNGQHRPKSNNVVRGKSQYNTQFRKVENTAQPQPASQPDNQNQLDKKRTKIAVRKLTRKRPEEEAELNPTVPTYSSFTTQVTQKYNFGEQDSPRYNTINRVQTTPSPAVSAAAVPQQRLQQNLRPKNDQSSTPAFFEPNPTSRVFSNDLNRENNGLLKQPIVAAGANYPNNQNRQTTIFQQQSRPTVPPAQNQQNQNYPQNFQQKRPNNQAGNSQNRSALGNFQTKPNQQQSNSNNNNNNNNNNNINFQGPRAGQGVPPVNNNFQSPRPSQPGDIPANIQNSRSSQLPVPTPNNLQSTRINQQNLNNFQTKASQTTGYFQSSRPSPTPTNVNFKQNQPANNFHNQARTVVQGNNNNGAGRTNQQNYATDFAANRQTSLPPNTRAQSINNGLLGRSTLSAQNRNYYNRNGDDFDEGENQEFLKTAPSNNFRPSDINSFKNNYKGDNFDRNATSGTSTTKYYTPTIVTTPKAPVTNDIPSTSRQNNYYSQSSTITPVSQNYYTQSVNRKNQYQPSTTIAPTVSFVPKQTTQAKSTQIKDTAYDYAYYDDGGSFSEYDALGDSLGDADFSRTSQRSKSRLI